MLLANSGCYWLDSRIASIVAAWLISLVISSCEFPSLRMGCSLLFASFFYVPVNTFLESEQVWSQFFCHIYDVIEVSLSTVDGSNSTTNKSHHSRVFLTQWNDGSTPSFLACCSGFPSQPDLFFLHVVVVNSYAILSLLCRCRFGFKWEWCIQYAWVRSHATALLPPALTTTDGDQSLLLFTSRDRTEKVNQTSRSHLFLMISMAVPSHFLS